MHKPPHDLPGVPLRLTRRERPIAGALWTCFVRVHACLLHLPERGGKDHG